LLPGKLVVALHKWSSLCYDLEAQNLL